MARGGRRSGKQRSAALPQGRKSRDEYFAEKARLVQCDRCGRQEHDSVRIFDEDGVAGTFCPACWSRLLVAAARRTDKGLDGYYRRTYGIDVATYAAMLLRQHGGCAICRQESDKPLVVDHDHGSGKVRGLLCNACNTGLGFFKDDPAALATAITYLLRRPRGSARYKMAVINREDALQQQDLAEHFIGLRLASK